MRRPLGAGLLAGVLLFPLVQSTTIVGPRVWVIAPFAIRTPGHPHTKPEPQRGVTYLRDRTVEIRTYSSGGIPEARNARVLRSAPIDD